MSIRNFPCLAADVAAAVRACACISGDTVVRHFPILQSERVCGNGECMERVSIGSEPGFLGGATCINQPVVNIIAEYEFCGEVIDPCQATENMHRIGLAILQLPACSCRHRVEPPGQWRNISRDPACQIWRFEIMIKG